MLYQGLARAEARELVGQQNASRTGGSGGQETCLHRYVYTVRPGKDILRSEHYGPAGATETWRMSSTLLSDGLKPVSAEDSQRWALARLCSTPASQGLIRGQWQYYYIQTGLAGPWVCRPSPIINIQIAGKLRGRWDIVLCLVNHDVASRPPGLLPQTTEFLREG